MRPAWLARTLVWAGVLLYLYWAVLKNHSDGAAFSVGLMLGAGTFTYNGRPRPVLLIIATTLIVAGALLLLPQYLQRGGGDPRAFFAGYLIGLLSPLIAWRLSGNASPR